MPKNKGKIKETFLCDKNLLEDGKTTEEFFREIPKKPELTKYKTVKQ